MNEVKSWNISMKKEVRRSNYWTCLCSELSAKSSLGFGVFSRLCLYCRQLGFDLVDIHCGKLPFVKTFQNQQAVLVIEKYSAHKLKKK